VTVHAGTGVARCAALLTAVRSVHDYVYAVRLGLAFGLLGVVLLFVFG